MTSERKKIIDHISRLEGQLASVKAEIHNEDPDCIRASQTLLSASRSFAGLREDFVESFLLQYFISPVDPKEEQMFTQLMKLIKG